MLAQDIIMHVHAYLSALPMYMVIFLECAVKLRTACIPPDVPKIEYKR